jgi:hypothetical protein
MSYLRYLCLVANSSAQHILCSVFLFFRLVASFSGLSIFDSLFGTPIYININ